jgi:Fe-S cluster biogenesis protein NfuA
MTHSPDNLKQRVERALAEHVAPALAMDGTQLEVLDVSDGVARIRLGGVCGTCPSSILAAVSGIEELLRQHVPEVDYVEAAP